LATVLLVVWALASTASPALAAIRRAAPVRGAHLPVEQALAAIGVAALSWSLSTLAAAQRADAI
jgi:hypothetical protein